MEDSMTEDREKWRKYCHGVANPRRLGSRTAKEQNRTSFQLQLGLAGVCYLTGSSGCFFWGGSPVNNFVQYRKGESPVFYLLFILKSHE